MFPASVSDAILKNMKYISYHFIYWFIINNYHQQQFQGLDLYLTVLHVFINLYELALFSPLYPREIHAIHIFGGQLHRHLEKYVGIVINLSMAEFWNRHFIICFETSLPNISRQSRDTLWFRFLATIFVAISIGKCAISVIDSHGIV